MTYIIIAKCKTCRREFKQRSRNQEGRKYCSKECRRVGMINTRRQRAGYFAITVVGGLDLAPMASGEANNENVL